MKVTAFEQLVEQIQQNGFSHRKFSLATVGEFTPEDADWNYKDIPHLEHVHDLVDNNPTFIDHKIVCSIAYQKIPPFFRVPISLVNFDYDKNHQVYYTTLLFWVLLIRTKISSTSKVQTKVETEYNLFSPKWLTWAFPFLKWVITRNYDDLMSGDLEMRYQRADLRKQGYKFRDDSSDKYSFLASMDIGRDLVVVPDNFANQTASYTVDLAKLKALSTIILGDKNHHGAICKLDNDTLSVYPRICSHAGACLDKGEINKKFIKCPWHGRQIKCLATKDQCSEDFSVAEIVIGPDKAEITLK